MQKILYFSLPAHGHVNPSLPVIEELARRGAHIDYYSLEPFRRSIERTGATFHDYGNRFDVPESGPGPFARLDTTIETLIKLTAIVLDEHLNTAKRSNPDYIVHDAFSPWGKFIAQALRLPSIVSVPSIAVNEQIALSGGAAGREMEETGRAIAAKMPQWMSEIAGLRERYGVAGLHSPFELMHAYGDLNLVYTSRIFQPHAGAFDESRFKFVGPSLPNSRDTRPFPYEELGGQPLLYISLGTVYNDRGTFFRACKEAFANTDWQVVMAVGQNIDLQDLEDIAGNFLVLDTVPQIEILKRASLFITHGGMNSVSEALIHNVPMLVVPQGGDQFWIAKRVEELGAGLSLAGVEPTAEILRQGIEEIASNPSFAESASRLGESLRTAGGSQRAVDEIESFHGVAMGGRR
jgi:MGT family glycosyltransferase